MKKIIILISILAFSFSSEAQSLKKLGLIFDQTTYNFGDVEQWNNQPAIFTFTNESKMSLTILPLFSENDLDVIIPDRPIAPGETIVIKALYYTDGKGVFSRSFPIYFGFRAEPVILKITGNIKSLSPEAYIQCPMSKPELAKPRIELVGDVAEIDTEIPLSGTSIEIIGLQGNKEVALFSNSRGQFGAKLPVGNYVVKVNHPNYIPYTGTIYIGQTSPPLRIRLTPLKEEPIFVQKQDIKIPEERKKETFENLNSKDDKPKVAETNKEIADKVPANKPEIQIEESKENKPYDKLERDIEYVKNEPRDNLYSGKKEPNSVEEIPKTLTTYKESKPEPIFTEIEPKQEIPKETIKENEVLKVEKAREEPKEIKPEQENILVEKETKPKAEKPVEEKIVIPLNNYTFRVINKNSLEAIEDATIIIADLYNNKNKYTDKTDLRGYSEMQIEANDYRFIATADGYISNEVKILKEDKSDIFKIYLTPVSDLYAEIYDEKRDRAKENEELLNKLSFGKTEFSFAKDEPEKIETTTPERTPKVKETEEPEEVIIEDKDIFVAQTETPEPIIVEKIVNNKAKEDSLKRVIEDLEEANKRENDLKNELAREKSELAKLREQAKIDSLNQYIEKLLAKNDAIKNDLEKVAEDKAALEAEKLRDKEKLENLIAKNEEAKEIADNEPFSTKKYQANNIMFLIDVSTSMEKGNKMEMLKTSIKNLVGILREVDRVAIITYNQQTNIVLESISGNNKTEILSAIDSLKTGGLTNGVKGLTTAYEMLQYYYIPNGNNQIILATDGLFSKYNNEMTENELNKLVKKQSDANMKLTVVGFGKDETGKELMEKLAKNGTGQYIQISNDYMTRDVLIKEIKLNSEIKD